MGETNPITNEHRKIRDNITEEVDLTDPRLVRITRLRLLTDPGFPMWDLSYCYGKLKDGSDVRVSLPQWQFSRKNLNGDLIAMLREAGVNGKRLGLWEPDVISKMW